MRGMSAATDDRARTNVGLPVGPACEKRRRCTVLIIGLIASMVWIAPPAVHAHDIVRCQNPAVSCAEWVRRFDGNAGNDEAWQLAVARDGSRVYVTGLSRGSGSGLDYLTVAYDAHTGQELWVARYNGPANENDAAKSVAVSNDNSLVFVTGSSAGNGTGDDIATLAYDADTGAELWVARYDGPGHGYDAAYSLALDSEGSRVFVAGPSDGAGTGGDLVTLGYDAVTGQALWVSQYDGLSYVGVQVYVARSSDGRRVFVALAQGLGSRHDYATIAYDAQTGQELWVATYSGAPGSINDPWGVATSPDNMRVFVTGMSWGGSSFDFATVAYDAATGQELWVARFTGDPPGLDTDWDMGRSLVVSPDSARVYVTGFVRNSLVSSETDAATVAYDAETGEQVWVSRHAQPDYDAGESLAVTPDGSRLYVGGWGQGVTTGYDFMLIAHDAASGRELWTQSYNGSGSNNDYGLSTGISADGARVFLTGYSEATFVTFDFATLAFAITEAPSASLDASPASGPVPLEVTFSLSGVDADGLLNAWSLDVDGDGMADYGGEGAPPSTLTHTYQARGTYTARLTVSDDHGAVGHDEVTITVENSPPVAVDDSATAVNGIRVTINVLANDSDPDGDSLTVTRVTQPAHGTAVINPNNTVTYDPECAFQGIDTFTYTIDDGYGGTDTGLVSVRVRKTSRRGSIPC